MRVAYCIYAAVNCIVTLTRFDMYACFMSNDHDFKMMMNMVMLMTTRLMM